MKNGSSIKKIFLQEYQNCVENINLKDLYFSDGQEFLSNFKDTCNKKLAYNDCLKTYTASYEAYLQVEKSDVLHNIENLIVLFFDYICNDEGQTMITLRSRTVDQCYQQNNDEILTCMSSHMREHKHFDEFVLLMKKNNCDDFRVDGSAIRRCVVAKYEDCLPELGKFYSDVFDKIFEYFSCH